AGDLALLYHSSTDPTGAAGLIRIAKTAYPDPSQFNRKSEYFDPASKRADPRWSTVDVEFVERFAQLVSLQQLRADSDLQGMLVLKRGMRLSVQPVSKEHFARVLQLAHAQAKLA